MLSRLFPKQIDNQFHGHWVAIWLLVPVVLGKIAMGTNSIINTRFVLASADGIPIESYATAAGDVVVALFALAGLFQLLLGLQGVLVLVRYRALIPFMYLLLLVQQAGAKAILLAHPIVRTGVPTSQLGSAFVYAILALTVIGLVMSLVNRSDTRARAVVEASH